MLGRNYLYREVLSADADCSGLEYYIQLGTEQGARSTHITRFLEHVLQPHVDKINSEYNHEAFSVSVYGNSVHGLLFRYFGPHSPSYAEARLNEILEGVGNALASTEEQKLAQEEACVAAQLSRACRSRDSEKGEFSKVILEARLTMDEPGPVLLYL